MINLSINLLEIPAYQLHWFDYIGYFGSFLTSITFIPQVYKAWKTKSVGDLSIWMISIVVLSTMVWLVYAFAIASGPVIVANTVVFILSLILIYFKYRFKR
ncbi:SemiSWEET family transporter [Segetibacter sp.]|uniref:SemiSWEET family sugar transporter n=1 Tax=Segetibacter sp. TaxID=2231182 RepID=UPI0026382688|nr:SemiSWEET family transporter [Segetibacter sp.]